MSATQSALPKPPAQSRGPRSAQPPAGGAQSTVNIDPVRLFLRYWPVLVLAGIIGGALGTGAHFVLLRVAPSFSTAATFRVEPVYDTSADTRGQGLTADEHQRFAGSQVAVMTSGLVLNAALENPEVQKTKWIDQFRNEQGRIDQTEALRELRSSISAFPVARTNDIMLSMTAGNRSDVATIVNGVADAYMDQIQEDGRRRSGDKREVLSARIKEIRTEIDRLRGLRDGVLERFQVRSAQDLGRDDAVLKTERIQSQMVDLTGEIAEVETLLDQIELDMTAGGVENFASESVLAEAERHPVILTFDQQLAAIKAELRSLKKSGINEEHPTYRRLKKQEQATQEERDAQFDQIVRQFSEQERVGLRNTLAALLAQKEDLESELAEAQARREDLVRAGKEIDQYEEEIQSLRDEQVIKETTLAELDTLFGTPAYERVSLIRRATIPNEVAFPKLTIMLPMGVVLIGGLTGGLILLRELFDQRVRGPGDVKIIPRLNVLGLVPDTGEDPAKPKRPETAFRDTPTGFTTESIRHLRTPIIKKMDQIGARSLLIVAGMPGSGATTVASNLGQACAASEERVLLIDANLRRPRVHTVCDVQDAPGLVDVLSGELDLDAAVQQTATPNLSVLPVGSAERRSMPERLGSEAMRALLAEAGTKYDRVLIDVAPSIVSGDSMALAGLCDASVLVVRAMNEKRGLVSRLHTQFSDARANLLGVVVNCVRTSAGGYLKKNIKATSTYQDKAA